ncbi:MAG: glycosyltransferase family 39 protein [Chloroflexi bacterium]|nr:glycosyltransferase family 39 protein [Chloroflexota bacterium]
MARRILGEHREIAIVLALFIALGIFYSVTTPLFEAPDEQWHFAYVQYVATARGLPVQTLDKPAHLARQEGSQPPLYYLMAAAATFWVDTFDFPQIVWENPHYGYNVPGVVNDNKNLFIHTSLESFPYHGTVLAIHVARLLSVVLGAFAVLYTYLLTLEIFPDRKFLAASASAVAGFVPQFLFVSSAVSNDSTIVAFSALSLWMVTRMLTADRRRPVPDRRLRSAVSARNVVLLGLATGLASLAKVSGAGLVVLGALVLIYTHRTKLDELVRRLCVFGAVVFVVAGWWYLRNLALYGELTGTAMMVRIFGARESPLTWPQLLAQLDEVWETFWIGFGWGNIRANPAVYTFLEILIGLSGLGLLFGFVRRRERLHPTFVKALPFFVLAFWIVIAFVELLHWMEITQAPHGRLFFPVLPALAPLAVFGISQWFPNRIEPIAARAMAVALFVLAVVAPFAILQPGYAYPESLASVPYLARPLNIAYGDKMKLLGYELSSEHVLPGGDVTLTLYWQSLATMNEDYSIGIHVLDPSMRVIGARNSYPGRGLLPTRLWRAGQIIRDVYWVPIAADAPAPSVAQIQVALYARESKRDLPAFDPKGQAVTPIVGRLKIMGANNGAAQAQNSTQFLFGQQINLIGYDLSPAGGLKLYWKRVAPIAADYTVFVHVLDANDKVVAQQDQQPADSTNPTSLWDDSEVVTDSYTLAVPGQGQYRIRLGLYRAETGERLPVSDGNGTALGDSVTLASFKVGE